MHSTSILHRVKSEYLRYALSIKIQSYNNSLIKFYQLIEANKTWPRGPYNYTQVFSQLNCYQLKYLMNDYRNLAIFSKFKKVSSSLILGLVVTSVSARVISITQRCYLTLNQEVRLYKSNKDLFRVYNLVHQTQQNYYHS